MITTILLVLIGAFAFGFVLLLVRLRKLNRETRTQLDLTEAGILASGLAHEIRNPLNSIKINLQLLQEDLEELTMTDDQQASCKETFRMVNDEILRLDGLMTNFLTYARPIDLKPERVELCGFLRELITFLKGQADEKQVTIELTVPEEPLELALDTQKIRQALLNILVNDIQIVGAGGIVQVALKPLRDLAVIRISDNGPGMTEDFMREIFVAFRSQRKGGTGLGLSIANRFIQAHGGGIKVDSTPGEGTTFSVILPRPSAE